MIKMIQDPQEYLDKWERKHNPFYPFEMRWDRVKVNRFLKDWKEQCTIPVVGSSSIDRNQAEFLWELLDDIEAVSDMFNMRDLNSWEHYRLCINEKLRKRFEVFKSDGYKLMTHNEYEEYKKNTTKETTASMSEQPLRYNGIE